MLNKFLFVTIFPILLVGCTTMKTGPPPQQEIVVKVQAAEPTDVKVQNGDNVHRSMQIPNQQGTLSPLSFIINDEAFVKIFSGIFPSKVTPLPFSPAERQSLKVPVLFVFGERDNLVGDPEAARELVQDIPDVRVEIVNAGHLMGAELPEQVDVLITEFFE